jgi:putative ABC transport system substrate-binding protein
LIPSSTNPRPGGNATGVTFLLDELASERLVLLKEAAPQVSRVAFLFNPAHVDNELREAERAAAALGVKLHLAEVRSSGDLDRAFDAAARAGVDALYVVSSRQTVTNIERIADFAAKNRLRQMPRASDELKIACGQPNFISPREPPARATRRSPGHQYVCAK